jgi:hypothetical protein
VLNGNEKKEEKMESEKEIYIVLQMTALINNYDGTRTKYVLFEMYENFDVAFEETRRLNVNINDESFEYECLTLDDIRERILKEIENLASGSSFSSNEEIIDEIKEILEMFGEIEEQVTEKLA